MLYAAYGSNLHPLRLVRRIASARLIGTGLLPNWSLAFNKLSKDGSGKCNIVEGGDGVHLAIYDLNNTDKRALDRIEGLGVGYANASVSVPGFHDCSVYVAQQPYVDGSLVPYDWYKELVVMGARLHGFPAAYLAGIVSTPARDDPDPGRRIRAWKTVERVRTGTV